MLLSLCCKHAATWQRCHSDNKAAAVVTEPVQRGSTNMFLFSLEQAITNHCLIPLFFYVCELLVPKFQASIVFLLLPLPRRFGSVLCGGERSPELPEGRPHPGEYGRCERDAGTCGNQKERRRKQHCKLRRHASEQTFKGKMYWNVLLKQGPDVWLSLKTL